MSATTHNSDSNLRETVLEHLFLGELLRCLWRRGIRDIEVLRAEVDRAGYDLVIEANGVLRHIQLKSSHLGAKTQKVGINTSLADKPSGCVIWIWFDPESMELGPFLWFGGPPGTPMPDLGKRVGKHTKANSEGVKTQRPRMRELNKGRFQVLRSLDEVADRLFE